LSFLALEDVIRNLPDQNVYRRLLTQAISEIKKAIYLKRSELPEYLQNDIESADIDQTTLSNPWKYICYYEGLASLINIH